MTKQISSRTKYINRLAQKINRTIINSPALFLQFYLENAYKQCKWYDIKLQNNNRYGILIPYTRHENFISIEYIKNWFTYRRHCDKQLNDPDINNMIEKFYKFEKNIKK